MPEGFFAEGGCACRQLRYRATSEPITVHCCHCLWCQRETGSAFVINAMIEADRVLVLQGETETIDTPSESGKGQKIVRCTSCKVALWSHYAGAGEAIKFLRVGTLDDPNLMPPRIHVFTSTKQGWVVLPSDLPVFDEFYSPRDTWPEQSLARFKAAKNR